ncbi:MAG: hypothetical protein AAB647_00380 [Patescibacteria group bacterium]
MGPFETSEPRPASVEMGLGQESPQVQAEVKPTVNEGQLKNPEQVERVTQEAIKRRVSESQAAYLERSNNLITSFLQTTRGKFFDPNRLRDGDLKPEEAIFIGQVLAEVCQEPVSGMREKVDLRAALALIEQSISMHSFPKRGGENGPPDEAAFDQTARSRKLFETQPGTGAAKRESYWNTLVSPYVTPEVAKRMLNDKTIMLLGGGKSHLKEEMVGSGISSREVINVDPYVSLPEPGADPVMPWSATDPHLVEKLQSKQVKQANEIWAEYSVPAYLKDPEEIKQLFTNINALLADGGTARIWPTMIGDSGNETQNLACKAALMESLQKLADSGKYEIVARRAAGRPGFTLYKIPPEIVTATA